MKKMILVLFSCLLIGTGTAFRAKAQIKIGHINSNELLIAMPERDSAAAKLERHQQSILRQSEELNVEYNRKLEVYLQQRDSLSPLITKTKEDELTDLQNNIRRFEAAAEQEFQNKQQELFQPVVEKAQNAIREVAAEKGFTYIFDIASQALLYFPEDETYDILPLVKAKLGLK